MRALQYHEKIKIAKQHVDTAQTKVDALYPLATNGDHLDKFEAAVRARDHAVRNYARHFVNLNYLAELTYQTA